MVTNDSDTRKTDADGSTTLCGNCPGYKGCPDGTHPSVYGMGQKPCDINEKVGSITDKEYRG